MKPILLVLLLLTTSTFAYRYLSDRSIKLAAVPNAIYYLS
jgi:hypothetical protein